MEQQKPQKPIKAYLKRKKPAGKPPVAPKDKPKANPKVKKPSPDKPREVSPLLTEMLQKLSGWTPHSNEGVLEAANRLAQAAREEIDRDTVKKAAIDTVEYAKNLQFHTLTYWNGVSSEHSLVTRVEYSKGNSTVSFHMIRVFSYNRIGTPAMLYSAPTYPVSDIHPPMSTQRKDEVNIQGKYYHIDMPQAMDAIMREAVRYSEQLNWLVDNAKVGKLRKLWDKSTKSTR